MGVSIENGDVPQYFYVSVNDGATVDTTIYAFLSYGIENPTDDDYAPYTGTTATLTLPETIYGGTVDVGTGVGSEDTLFLELAIADMDNSEDFPGWKKIDGLIKCVGENWNTTLNNELFVSCNICSNGAWIGVNTVKPSNQSIFLVKDFFGLTQSQWKEQYPELTVQICLKLATPTAFQATGNQSFPALPGTNTVKTDDGDITVTGASDPIATITALQNRVSALESAALN